MVTTAIKTEHDYKTAMSRIDALMDAAPGTAECDELDVLAELVEAYEKIHFPIELPVDGMKRLYAAAEARSERARKRSTESKA